VSHYVNKDDSFSQDAPIVRECPHCGAHAELIATATPTYATVVVARPANVALGFRCSACSEPRFARAQVRAIESDRIVLSAHLTEIERSKEHFQFAYLPDRVAAPFKEALACYSADCHTAFAIMSRRTADLSQSTLAASSDADWRSAFDNAVHVGALEAETAAAIEAILFGPVQTIPEIDASRSAVLIEVMKDILYQCHVRRAKFQAAMNMRRYFADESDNNVTSIRRGTRRVRTA
jgi:hypothetical protein